MLVLSRFKDESIVIGDNIVITIVDIRAGSPTKVRLGIEAPENVTIHREEIYEKIQAEKAKADRPPLSDAVAAMRNRREVRQ